MKKFAKGKFLAVVTLVLLFVLAFLPKAAQADEENQGYFYLSVATNSETVIAPTRVTYTAGQTVLEAIENSDFNFVFQGDDKTFIESIEGKVGNFVRFYDYSVDGNDYDLNVEAANIHVLSFSETEGQHNDAVVSLIELLGEVSEKTDNVLNYEPAKTAYDNALKGLHTASEETAQTLYNNLSEAVSAYEALLEGDKYTIHFAATQNGVSVANEHIKMTDSYGNVTETDGSSINVIPVTTVSK